MVHLAVGVIIGAAFGAIVTSLVNDVVMPIIGAVTGGLAFPNYYTPLSSKVQSGLSYADAKRCGSSAGSVSHRGFEFSNHCVGAVSRNQRDKHAEEGRAASAGRRIDPGSEVAY